MKRTLSIILFALLLFSACSTPPPVSPVVPSEPTLTFIPTLTALPSATVTRLPSSTVTPPPSNTPMPPNGSPTPSVPMVLSADKKDVQCYTGPGVDYQPGYIFKAAEIIGKDKAGLWWYIQTYDKQANPVYCWVGTKSTHTAGNLSTVPVTEAEKASVTAVKVSVDGESVQELACGQDIAQTDFHFTGKITTSGPVDKLRYQWVTDAGMRFSPKQTQIRAWDAPAQFKLTISVPTQAGTYSLDLRTISPNEIVGIVQFSVKCR